MLKVTVAAAVPFNPSPPLLELWVGRRSSAFMDQREHLSPNRQQSVLLAESSDGVGGIGLLQPLLLALIYFIQDRRIRFKCLLNSKQRFEPRSVLPKTCTSLEDYYSTMPL